MNELLTFATMGLMLGLAGNAHCVGMCGPIALALPTGDAGSMRRTILLSLYSVGRVATYTVLGIVFGLLGLGVRLAGWQQGLSIAVGLILIIGVLLPYALKSRSTRQWPWQAWVQHQFGRLIRKPGTASFLGIGFLNGLLPCGLVYTALAGASVAGSVQGGAVFMAAFGVGTIPALFAMAWFSKAMSPKVRGYLKKAIPVLTIIIGILFILRGLGLGIPMISPPTEVLQVGMAAGPVCH